MGISNKMDVLKTCALAKSKAQHQLVPITYILFLTKLQKRQTLQKGFALLKNDITGSEPTVKILDT